MADITSANVTVGPSGGGFASGTGYLVIAACVSKNADCKPRVFASASAILALHDYSPGADYASMHVEATRKGVIFIPLPIVTPGAIGRQNTSKVTGTSAITVAAAPSGILDEVDGMVRVDKGGTIGQAGIVISVSADGGRVWKKSRLLTATSYTFQYLGIVVSFGAGTLNDGDVYTFSTTAPKWDGAGLSLMRAKLADQKKRARSWLIVGDLATKDEADLVLAEVNGYETANQRFTYARCQLRDRVPLAAKSNVTVKMTGNPNLTFAEVGASGDTITRASGSWIADGFAVGQTFTVAGSASNNVTGKIAALTATVMTLDTTDLTPEGPVGNISVTASETLTFAEVGPTGDTLTRSSGSWLDDGFRAGDTVTITGTGSNNVTGAVTGVTATVLTFGTTDLAPEAIRSDAVTITKGETMDEWVSSLDSAFAGVDDQKRIDLGIGRGRKLSPLTGWKMRRPVQWAATTREYQHDVHIATYEKDIGVLDGWDLDDVDGHTVEYDDRTSQAAAAARFTSFRTWANGPEGAFMSLSLTRAPEDSQLSRTHNMAVANVFCTIVQAETENWVGRSMVLNKDGTATEASLRKLEISINGVLQRELLTNIEGEGQRASAAAWRASRTDTLNVPGAKLNGVGNLGLNGTLENISTVVNVT